MSRSLTLALDSVLPAPRQTLVKRMYGFVELLTPDGYNPKLKKGRARGYSTTILHLAPHTLSGANLCANASPGCIAACLNTAGHGGINLDINGLNEVQRARIARSVMMRTRRFDFKALLVKSINTHIRRALKHGLIPWARLNGTSDIPWEHYKLNDGRTVFETWPDVQFYDYTKDVDRALSYARGGMPANYHLTFSRSELNDPDCARVLAAGGNVAVVMNVCGCPRTCDHPLPDIYMGHRVINGDLDDLRPLDPRGVIVGLRAKGRGKRDTSGFVVRLAA